MKLKILFVALFVAGVAASIALASPADHGSGSTTATTTTGTTATTGTTTTGKHDGDDNDQGKGGAKANGCRQVELKGTVAASTLTVTVTKASKPGQALGTSVTLTVPAGPVKVHGRLCTTGAAAGAAGTQTLQLSDLKVGKTNR